MIPSCPMPLCIAWASRISRAAVNAREPTMMKTWLRNTLAFLISPPCSDGVGRPLQAGPRDRRDHQRPEEPERRVEVHAGVRGRGLRGCEEPLRAVGGRREPVQARLELAGARREEQDQHHGERGEDRIPHHVLEPDVVAEPRHEQHQGQRSVRDADDDDPGRARGPCPDVGEGLILQSSRRGRRVSARYRGQPAAIPTAPPTAGSRRRRTRRRP